MSSKKSAISEDLKYEIAKELGFYYEVKKDGDFGSVPSRQCGKIKKLK